MEAVQSRFTDELLKEVVPFVEKHLPREGGPGEPGARRGCRWAAARPCGSPRPTRTSSPTWASGAPASSAANRRGVRDSGTSRSSRRRSRQQDRSSCSRSASATRISPLNGSKAWPSPGEARHQARAAHQRRRPHLDQLAPLPQRVRARSCSAPAPTARRQTRRKKRPGFRPAPRTSLPLPPQGFDARRDGILGCQTRQGFQMGAAGSPLGDRSPRATWRISSNDECLGLPTQFFPTRAISRSMPVESD